jgi:hypothetical protein
VQKRAKGKHHERLRRLIDAALYAAKFAIHGKHQRWVHIEAGVQGDGLMLAGHVDKTLDTRAKLARFLDRNFHLSAAYMSLDLGTEKQSLHFHVVALMDYAPRELLQSWLRSTDCTVPGCSHPADDRCEACKKAKHRCEHPHADGTPRCNGSWYVHIEAIGVKCPVCKRRVGKANCCGTTFADRSRKGFREVLKYSAAPVDVANPPEPGEPFNEGQFHHAEGVLQFFLATRHRHRITSYQAASLDFVELGLVEPEAAQKKGCCPCGEPWTWEQHGTRRSSIGYEWGPLIPYQGGESRAPPDDCGPPGRAGPVWVQEGFAGFADGARPTGMREG